MNYVKGFLFSAIGLTIVLVFTNNCSHSENPNSSPAPAAPAPVASGSEDVAQAIGSESFTIAGATYEITRWSLTSTSATPLLFAVVTAAGKKPTPAVIVSVPYDLPAWSADPQDQRWIATAGSESGTNISEGLNWENSESRISFQKKNASQSLQDSGSALFLPAQISVVMVFHRFYLGRSLSAYLDDVRRVRAQLSRFPNLDSNKLLLKGVSLGGLVVAQTVAREATGVSGVILQSPLLDLGQILNYFRTLPVIYGASAALLQQAQSFFAAYLLRAERDFQRDSALRTRFTVNDLKQNLKPPTLLLHDSWDTLVPFPQAQDLATSTGQNIFPVFYQHASAISYPNFQLAHYQAGEGYSDGSAALFFMSFSAARVFGADFPGVLLYDSVNSRKAMQEIRNAQLRGQSIAWLQSRLSEICDMNYTYTDYTGVVGETKPGKSLVREWLNTYWAQSLTDSNVCAWVRNASF